MTCPGIRLCLFGLWRLSLVPALLLRNWNCPSGPFGSVAFFNSAASALAFVSPPLPSLVCLLCLGVLCMWCVLHLLYFAAWLACFCCLVRLLLLLGSPAFAAAPGLFWYASTRLPCTPDFPVRVPVQYPLLPAPALKFVLLRLLLVTVCELGWFCAPACACSHASLVWLTCSCLSLSSCV